MEVAEEKQRLWNEEQSVPEQRITMHNEFGPCDPRNMNINMNTNMNSGPSIAEPGNPADQFQADSCRRYDLKISELERILSQHKNGSNTNAKDNNSTYPTPVQFRHLLDSEIGRCDHFYRQRASSLSGLSGEGCDLSVMVLELDSFAARNVQRLHCLLSMHDQLCHPALMPIFRAKLRRCGFCDGNALDSLFLALSLRIHGPDSLTQRGPETDRFERTSLKFWVPLKNLAKLVCTILVHVPAYSPTGESSWAQQTTSVYCDNRHMGIYNARLMKEEGSSLLRFRWYGGGRKVARCEGGNGKEGSEEEEEEEEEEEKDPVYVELKVHHDKWVLENSYKTRFKLSRSEAVGFLQGSFQPAESFAKKYSAVVESAELIAAQHLLPTLRTVYSRTAFQNGMDDSVRLSLDVGLTMQREPPHPHHLLSSELVTTDNDLHIFPFAVLEVKLHKERVDDPPPWIQELLNSSLVCGVPKFSKYCHGAAMLFDVSRLPYWTDPDFLREAGLPNTFTRQHLNTRHLSLTHRSAAQTSTSAAETEPRGDFRRGGGGGEGGGREDISMQLPRPASSSNNNTNPSSWGWLKALTSKDKAGRKGSAEGNMRMEGVEGKGVTPMIAPRVRVEPKTFFANERTYLQWFNAATMIGSVAVAMTALPSPQRVAGYGFLPVALLICIYGLYVYHWRTSKLQQRVLSVSYADRCGPTVLTVIFIIVLLFATIYTAWPFKHSSDLSSSSSSSGSGNIMTSPFFSVHRNTPPPPSGHHPGTQASPQSLAPLLLDVKLPGPPAGEMIAAALTIDYLTQRLIITSGDGRMHIYDSISDVGLSWQGLWLPPLGPVAVRGTTWAPRRVASPFFLTLSTPSFLPINYSDFSISSLFDSTPSHDSSSSSFDTPDNSGDSGRLLMKESSSSQALYILSDGAILEMSSNSTSSPLSLTAPDIVRFSLPSLDPLVQHFVNLTGLTSSGYNRMKGSVELWSLAGVQMQDPDIGWTTRFYSCLPNQGLVVSLRLASARTETAMTNVATVDRVWSVLTAQELAKGERISSLAILNFAPLSTARKKKQEVSDALLFVHLAHSSKMLVLTLDRKSGLPGSLMGAYSLTIPSLANNNNLISPFLLASTFIGNGKRYDAAKCCKSCESTHDSPGGLLLAAGQNIVTPLWWDSVNGFSYCMDTSSPS